MCCVDQFDPEDPGDGSLPKGFYCLMGVFIGGSIGSFVGFAIGLAVSGRI